VDKKGKHALVQKRLPTKRMSTCFLLAQKSNKRKILLQNMIDLYLIRHAESEMNTRADIIGGNSSKTPLSHRGEKQAELLGERLKNSGIRFDTLHSSTATRAFETARIAGRKAGFTAEDIIQSDDILEIDQGDWTGKNRTDIYTPNQIEIIEKQNIDFTPPNGESQRMVEQRMHEYIANNCLTRQNQTIAVFSHGLAIKCFLRGVMDSDPRLTYKIVIDNTAICRVKYSERGWHLVCVNDVSHIPPEQLLGDHYLRR
jgi:broad specificity phosphatase PhoE